MTKKFCDRCGVETTHNQSQIFAPGLYAGGGIYAQWTDSKRVIGQPKLYDICKDCEKKAVAAFTKFMGEKKK